jgi:hypothetical protein
VTDQPDLIPIEDAAPRLGTSVDALRKRLERGKTIKGIKLGHHWYVHAADVLDATAGAGHVPTADAANVQRPPDAGAASMVALQNTLTAVQGALALLEGQLQVKDHQLAEKDQQITHLQATIDRLTAHRPSPTGAQPAPPLPAAADTTRPAPWWHRLRFW